MSENQKKLLAKQIKEDLQKDLEEAKKEEKSERGFGGCSWRICLGESCCEYRGNEWRLSYFGSLKDDSYKKYEKRRRYGRGEIGVFPEELEPNDWKEIENLIQQVKKLEDKKKEKENQKYQQEYREEQDQIDQKLKSEPNLFFYDYTDELWGGAEERAYHFFLGYQDGKKFHLRVRELHPNITEYFNRPKGYGYSDKKERFFVIKGGFENIPLEKYGHVEDNSDFAKYVKERYPDYFKDVEFNDKITITEFKENSEKGQPVENKSTDNNISSQLKELNDKTLLQYFQKNDIKSIKLAVGCGKLTIKYNDSTSTIDVLGNFPELKGLDKYLQNKDDKTVNYQELRLKNNSDTTSTTKSQDNNIGLWIGCGIGGVLVIIVTVGLLLKRKNRIKKH